MVLLSFNQHLLLPKTFQPFTAEDFTPFVYSQPPPPPQSVSASVAPPLTITAGNNLLTQPPTQTNKQPNVFNENLSHKTTCGFKDAVSPPPALSIPPQQPYKNTLFWCCFVAANGRPPFGEPPLPIELKTREEMGVFFRKNARVLKDKRHRITLSDMEEIITDLMTISTRPQEYNTGFGVLRTNLAVCIAYSVYWKINVYIACPVRRIFTSFLSSQANDDEDDDKDDDETTPQNNPKHTAGNCLLFLRGNSFVLCEDVKEIQKIKRDYLELCHYKKPLHAVSHYKTIELQEIYERVGVVCGDSGVDGVVSQPPTKKADIYRAVEIHSFTQPAGK